MKKIRVLELCNSLSLGGTERVMQEIAINIDKRQFEVIVGVNNLSGPRLEILRKHNIKVVQVSTKKILQMIENKEIDIIHSHNIDITPFIGKIVTIKHVIFLSDFNEQADLNLIISKTLTKKISKYHSLKWGQNYFIIYNPQNVDSWEKYKLNNKTIEKTRLAYGIKKTELLIGRLGRAEPSKTDFLLLKTAPKIASTYKNTKFIFVGLPWLFRAILKRKKILKNRVIFLPETGDDKKIAEFYQMIDIFWHTSSRGETFGITNTEAMTFKKPVITHSTNINKFLKIDNAQIEIVDNMKTGIVANYPQDILNAVEILSNKKISEKLGENGYNKVKSNYDIKIVIKNLENAIKYKLNKKNRIKIKPDEKEINYFIEKEYSSRLLDNLRKASIIQKCEYKLQKAAYLLLEKSYLLTRYILRRFLKIDLEKKEQ